MRALVRQSGYVLDSVNNIWISAGYEGIGYTDGDEVETRIASIIQQALDISVLSRELRKNCTDWPSIYHLSGTRANIMRPFEDILKGDILEIGAGCGAVTRYLGECGANVLALEGSPRRAAIARSRTRDLENVTVLAEKFDQFQCDHQFDVITLIGVLEYANLFTSGENPTLAMLERVRSLLKPDGKLIVAIENQLGLKYFAGAPEEHLGRPMYGIEGRYRRDQPQTFGRVVLQKLLREAGFMHTVFMAPFPDYKLPFSIVTEAGFNAEDFDASVFAWQSVRRDPQFPPIPCFSPELVWPTLEKNALALDLANSFLVLAGKLEKHDPALSVYAWHFSTERAEQFCKQTSFRRADNGFIEVHYRLLSKNRSTLADGKLLRFSVPDKARYAQGKPLSHEFILIVSRDGWSIEEVGGFFKHYIVILRAIAHSRGSSIGPFSESTLLPGEFFDYLPQNIIVDDFGAWRLIDEEWVLHKEISARQLVFRASLSLLNLISRFGYCANQVVSSPLEFFQACYASIGFNITLEALEDCVRLEYVIQAEVSQQVTDSINIHAWLISPSLPRQTLNGAVAERDGQIASLTQMVAERDKQIAERDRQMQLIVNSRSWKLTRPLRFVSRLVRDELTSDDRQRLAQELRKSYHRLPLPIQVKRFASFAYHEVLGKIIRRFRRSVARTASYCVPTIKPAASQEGLPDYIIWGVIDWHFRHQRPQQLAKAVAGTRRRVFYVSPNLVDDDRVGFDAEALDSSGLLFQIKLFVKGAPQIYSQAPTLPLVSQLRTGMGEVLEWADCERLVSLVQHPFWGDVASVLPNRELVYDCMDHHQGFGGMGEDLAQLEKKLFAYSDLTITTSEWLNQSVAKHAQYHAVIRNAADYELFSQVPESTYCDPQGRRIIGYYGAIAEWFDLDLVEAVAKRHPECAVMIIGADTVNADSRLGKLPNVTFIGEVSYCKLPHYLYGFDLCLLPFKVVPLTLATNPVKIYEYLSAGKPVVAVNLPEMAQFDGLVYVAADCTQFLQSVDALLSEPEPRDLVQRRQDFARGQTWKHRAEALIQQAESSDREARVSVIVVTYNNLELTRTCLASIDGHSQYENLEIIVIDNASSDGSIEFLKGWASVNENHRLILNDNNRGFAAANNQGLNIATGEFLVMLNNDTYVTSGWIRSLVNHPKRDTTVGLIGPVTNNIGNEAKIDIAYADMSEMLVKSAAYTRRHVGQLYPLRTVAFFCVMMKRETFERVGQLDEAFGRGWFEDDDYCRRVEQVGLRVVCAEDVFVHHQLSASFNKLKQQDRQELFEENKKIYEAKWGVWIPHGQRRTRQRSISDPIVPEIYADWQYMSGYCNVCGKSSRFFYKEVKLWRESLNCEHCHTTSRYRSIAQGILRAISELTGNQALSLAALPCASTKQLHVYDTQPSFYGRICAYPLPDLLKATGWIEVELSQYKPNEPMGKVLAGKVTNQNLECLTYSGESLDLVITSDVMEHVRLDDLAHREIYRVLKPGGIYIFTVPHDRSMEQTMIRVQVSDPSDSRKDVHLLEPEYHGDANSDGGTGVLSYRVYGRDLESYLSRLGFEIEYSRKDIANFGILNTELYYCRKKPARLIDDHDIGRGSGGQGRCVGAHASTTEPSIG